MNPHELGFVEYFVRRTRQERVRALLGNPRKRRKFVQEFAHHGTYILAPECLRSIEPGQHRPDSIYSILHGFGAPDTCHVISEGNLDGAELGLLEALRAIIGGGVGTVISCLPGKLGYFEGELRERYILQR